MTRTITAMTDTTDKIGSIERHGIEPIPQAERHGSAFELFRLWVGANVNYVVIVTGAFTLAMGVTFFRRYGRLS